MPVAPSGRDWPSKAGRFPIFRWRAYRTNVGARRGLGLYFQIVLMGLAVPAAPT